MVRERERETSNDVALAHNKMEAAEIKCVNKNYSWSMFKIGDASKFGSDDDDDDGKSHLFPTFWIFLIRF